MDLLTYLRILRRRWAVVAVAVALGAAIGVGSALLGGDEGGGRFFKATHVLFFDANAASDRSATFTNLDQIAVLTTSGDVPRRVGTKLGEDGRQLAEHVLVTTNSVTGTLEITAAAGSSGGAEEISDNFAEVLVSTLNEREQQRFEEDRDRVVARLDNLQAQINGFDAQLADPAAPNREVLLAQRNGTVNQYRLTYEQFQQLAEGEAPRAALATLEAAQAVPIGASEYDERLRLGQLGQNLLSVGQPGDSSSASEPTSGSVTFEGPVSRGFLGAILGLLAGVAFALVAERLDRRLRTRQDIEEAFGLPVIAEVPLLNRAQRNESEIVSFTSPLSRTAEAHRGLRSALLFQFAAAAPPGPNGEVQNRASAGEPDEVGRPLVLLVTSPLPNEGKTTTSANLAAVFAEAGASVLAINCDFRRPSLHRYLEAPNEPRRILDTMIPGVKLVAGVLTDDAANPAQVVAEQRQVISAARKRFDVVLLDTAPFLTTNDAVEIIPYVDLVVLVARPEVSTIEGAQRARETLERVQAPAAGVVLVGEDATTNDPYYYYASMPAGAAARPRRERGAGGQRDGADDATLEIAAVTDGAGAGAGQDAEFFTEAPGAVAHHADDAAERDGARAARDKASKPAT